VNSIKRIRIRPAGVTIFVDITVTVDRQLSMEKAHDISDNIEKKIKDSIPEADITIHLEPHKNKH
jgi:divalent metal cation (Fe/Co/Zn/Cd) transporter